MSLEKSENFSEFIFKRWLRLFPCMLFSSFFIYFGSLYFYERPNGLAKLEDLICGLFFIEPSWVKLLFGWELSSLEGGFWSLYVEFKFYLISGCVYFALGRLGFFVVIFFAAWFVLALNLWADLGGGGGYILYKIKSALSMQHFSWFLAGSAVYMYKSNFDFRWLCLGLLSVVMGGVILGVSEISALLVIFFLCVLFLCSNSCFFKMVLESRVLQFFGFISYPLYLLHEGFMVSIVKKMGKFEFFEYQWLYPIFALFVISVISYFVANKIEPVFRNAILVVLEKRFAKIC